MGNATSRFKQQTGNGRYIRIPENYDYADDANLNGCECYHFINVDNVQQWLTDNGTPGETRTDGTISEFLSSVRSGCLEKTVCMDAREVNGDVPCYDHQPNGLRYVCRKHGLNLLGVEDKRGRGLKEKLAEMETFRDILCRQIDTLQSYFDSCASALQHGAAQDLLENIDEDIDLMEHSGQVVPDNYNETLRNRGKAIESILSQHGSHAVDFKSEAFTFKATTAGIIATLSHCMEIMRQREDAWRKRLEKETKIRQQYEEAYHILSAEKRPHVVAQSDFSEDEHHHAITDDEYYDAPDAAVNKTEECKDKRTIDFILLATADNNISLSPLHPYYKEVIEVVDKHLRRLDSIDDELWQCVVNEGSLKVYQREMEENGVVLDPLKAIYTVQGITGHEVCSYYFDRNNRTEWETTMESSRMVEQLSEDTIVLNSVVKRVWPASQRDACFWSHMRHIQTDDDHDGEPGDTWLVVNHSCEHPACPKQDGKYVRVSVDIALICKTIIVPPSDGGEITRDHIACQITYTADVHPGGWVPSRVLRSLYKREYPKFLRHFSHYVTQKTADKPILF